MDSMTLLELSRKAGLTYGAVYRYIQEDRLKAEKVGGKWHVPAEEAERFIRARKARASGRFGGDDSHNPVC